MSSKLSTVTVTTFTNKNITFKVNFKSTTTKDIIDMLVLYHNYSCDIENFMINFIHNQSRLKCRISTLYELGLRNKHEDLQMYVNHLARSDDSDASQELIEKSNNSRTQIFVKHVDSKSYTVSITDDMTITDIKKLVDLKIGFPHHSFYLLRSKRRLEPDRTVGDYMINKEETLQLIPKLRGGAVKETLNFKSLIH